MDDVDAYTGGDRATAEFRDWLSGGRIDLEPVRVLEGPSGTGKTTLARALIDELDDGFFCVVASGDPAITTRDLLPFDAVYSSNFGREFKQIIPEFASAAPYGSAVKTLLQFVLAHHELRQTNLTRSLGQPQRDVLFQLQRRVGRRRLLLVMDNVRSWDAASLRLLQMMWSPDQAAAFPFLARTSYLAVVTPEDPVAAPEVFDATLNLVRARATKVHRPTRPDFPAVLNALGLRNTLEERLANDLYALSGGHLALALRLVAYLNRGESAEALAREASFESLCLRIVDDRLRDSAAEADLRALLTAAAVIGMSFSTAELGCLAGESAVGAIDRAIALKLLVGDRERLAFAHELLQRVIAEASAISPDLHARFAECLRVIDPSDFTTRAMHHERGGQPEQALILRAHAALNVHVRPDARLVFDECGPIGRFVIKMQEANRRYEAGDYEGAITAIEYVDFTIPASLIMERDGLIARCLIKTLDIAKQRRAVNMLGAWIEEKHELDVWQRVMQQYVVALGFVGEVAAAATAARRLVVALRGMVNGPRQRWMVHRLALNADVYEGAEGANGVLRDAVDFFGPSDEASASRDPLLYWVGVCNLVANEILRGDLDAALQAVKRCAVFVSSLDRQSLSTDLPRRDIAANNAILAEYLAGVLEPSQAAKDMEALANDSLLTNDIYLLRSNAAALRLLSGDRHGQAAILTKVFDALGDGASTDPYYVYFIGNNLVVALVAEGDVESARRLWSLITPLIERAAPKLTGYLRPRHDLLTGKLTEPRPTYEALEAALTDYARRSPGPAWPVFAKPVLLSELQFFSDL